MPTLTKYIFKNIYLSSNLAHIICKHLKVKHNTLINKLMLMQFYQHQNYCSST